MTSSMSVDRILRSVILIGQKSEDPDMVDRIINGNNPSLRLYARNVSVRLVRETPIEKIDLDSVLKIFQDLVLHYPRDTEVVDLRDQLDRRRRHVSRRRQSPQRHTVDLSPKPNKSMGMSGILEKLKTRQNVSPNIPSNSYLFDELIKEFSPKKQNIKRAKTPVLIPSPLSPRRIVLSDSSDESCESSRYIPPRPLSRSTNISIEDEYDIARAFKLRKWWSKWTRFVSSQQRVVEGFKKLAKIFSTIKKRQVFENLIQYNEWKMVEDEKRKIRIERLTAVISLRTLVESWDKWRHEFDDRISTRRDRVGGVSKLVCTLVSSVDRRFREVLFCMGLHAETRIVRQYEQSKGVKIMRKILRKILNKNFNILKNQSSNVHLFRFCGVLKLGPVIEKLMVANQRTGWKTWKQKIDRDFQIQKLCRCLELKKLFLLRKAFSSISFFSRTNSKLFSIVKLVNLKKLAFGFHAFAKNSIRQNTNIRALSLVNFISLIKRRTDQNMISFLRVLSSLSTVSFSVANSLESKLLFAETTRHDLSVKLKQLENTVTVLQSQNNELKNQKMSEDHRLVSQVFRNWSQFNRRNFIRKKATLWFSSICLRKRESGLRETLYILKSKSIDRRRSSIWILTALVRTIVIRTSIRYAFSQLKRAPLVSSSSAIDRMKTNCLHLCFARLKTLFIQSRKIKRSVNIIQRNSIRFAFNAIRENYWKLEILLSYAECDRMMDTCQAKLEAYDACMRMGQERAKVQIVRRVFGVWRSDLEQKGRKISRMYLIVEKMHYRNFLKIMRCRKSDHQLMSLVRLLSGKQLVIFSEVVNQFRQSVFECRIRELALQHSAELEAHDKVARDLAEAATEIEADYHKMKREQFELVEKTRGLEMELENALGQLQKLARENTSLKNSELKLREDNRDSRRILEEHEQYRRLADQQRMEIERLSSRVGDHGKLTNSIAFYKNKCMLQSEQISALQMKLRESTTSPILSSSMRGGTSQVLFPSPVNQADLTYASTSIPRVRRRTSVGDYTPTGDESSRRNHSYLSDRRRYH